MSIRTDVAIIGGGVIGASIAYRLAKAGKKVVLCEMNDFGAGATGACDQCVFLQSKNPGIHLKLALDSSDIFENLAEELDYPIDFFRHGGMITIENEMEMKVMSDFAKKQKKLGLDVRIISRAEAADVQRGLAEHLLGCTYSPVDGHVNPFKLTFGYVEAAQRYGAKFLIDTEVTGFWREGKRIRGIKTSGADVEAPITVLAAGAWTPILAEKLGLAVPIKPRRGQIAITEPVAPYIRGNILSGQYIMAKYHPEILTNAEDPAIRLGVGLSITQTVRGEMLIGATREFAGYDTSNTREGVRELLKNAARIIPGLSNLHVVRVMAGLRPYTSDGLPLLGFIQGMEGLFLATGHEGDGIALSAITGVIACQLICEGKAYMDVSELDPGRSGIL